MKKQQGFLGVLEHFQAAAVTSLDPVLGAAFCPVKRLEDSHHSKAKNLEEEVGLTTSRKG